MENKLSNNSKKKKKNSEYAGGNPTSQLKLFNPGVWFSMCASHDVGILPSVISLKEKIRIEIEEYKIRKWVKTEKQQIYIYTKYGK